MKKDSGRLGFFGGFMTATILLGAAVAFAAIGIYTPDPHGDWIRDISVYQPGTDDQINVLADIQPGAAVQMLEAGLRFNVLNQAGKKQNWDLAAHESAEIGAAFGTLEITRPALQASLQTFVGTDLAAVDAAIATQNKSTFKAAMKDLATACNSCHVSFGKPFFVIKSGKSALPLK